MTDQFSFSEFIKRFPTDEHCLEEIKRIRFRSGIYCILCKRKTNHYKLTGRTAYSCKICRHQVYPLAGTLFQKTTTPLRLWFYAIFLITQSNGNISAKQLEKELDVTYKTAWKMCKEMKLLMAKSNTNLLAVDKNDEDNMGKNTVRKWIFFNKIEFTVTQKKTSPG